MGRIAPGDHGRDGVAVEGDFLVEDRVRVGGQGAPIGDGLVPLLAFRRIGAPGAIFDGLFVGRDDAGARACLDGHVADRHPAFHGKRVDGGAGVFDGVARPAGGADLADNRQDDVLAADPEADPAGDVDTHHLRFALPQGLGRHDVLDLGRADAEGDAAERPVRGGVRIAADQGEARQGDALFGADHMDDAVAVVGHAEMGKAHFLGKGGQHFDRFPHFARRNIVDRLGGGGHAVIGDAEQLVRFPDRKALRLQRVEGAEMQVVRQMPVDIEQDVAVFALEDDVLVPDFLEYGFAHGAFVRLAERVGLSHFM